MRTTLTLEEDVAVKLKSEMRRSGTTLKATVNRLLRLALQTPTTQPRRRFRIHARDLGELRPGISIESVSDALEQLEEPTYR
jgi:hypothetical protein